MSIQDAIYYLFNWLWPAPGNYTINQHYQAGHPAIDIHVPLNTPIFAPAGGTAEGIISDSGYGNHVIIRTVDGAEVVLAHLNELAFVGSASVSAGQQIGTSGSTGNSTGPHLHFEVRGPAGAPAYVDPWSAIWYFFDQPNSTPPGGPNYPTSGATPPPGSTPGYNPPGSTNYPGTSGIGLNPLDDLTEWLKAIAWVDVAFFVVGLVLIVLGLYSLTQTETAKSAAKDLAKAGAALSTGGASAAAAGALAVAG